MNTSLMPIALLALMFWDEICPDMEQVHNTETLGPISHGPPLHGCAHYKRQAMYMLITPALRVTHRTYVRRRLVVPRQGKRKGVYQRTDAQ